jgi:membrane fusion protein, copper/silver efflux system
MNKVNKSRVAVLIVAGSLLAYGGYWAGTRATASGTGTSTRGTAPLTASPASNVDPATGKRVLYWHDPMVPGKRFDKPGKSPFMDMQLVPVYAEEGGEAAGVKISPSLQQNLGIRFATVRRAEQAASLELVGSTQFDESKAEVVQSRVAGFVDKLHVRAPQQQVKRGQAFASIYVPDWLAPQEEYLMLKRSGDTTLTAAARQRMRALSIPDSMVAAMDRTGRPQSHLSLSSPVSGVVTELAVREGAQVTPGMTIAKVVGMNTIWLLAEVPEAVIGSARVGMQVTATTAGDSQRTYRGKVGAILPGVSTTTRTAQARLELDNKDGTLVPGMLMRVVLSAAAPESRLLVPSEAIIATGKRSIVYVADENNSMRPVLVSPGREIGNETEVINGLREGQRVVASGQFLIDSEANLKSIQPHVSAATPAAQKEALPMPMPTPMPMPSSNAADASMPQMDRTKAAAKKPPAQTQQSPTPHQGTGKVEQVTDEALTLSHGPIASLQWPAMTMDFKKPRPDSFKDVKVGQTVQFSFVEGKDGYELKSVVAPPGGKP